MKILLLEDSTTDADLIQRQLVKTVNACNIKIVTTLKDARDLLDQEDDFDVALLDVNLPDGSGLELLIDIKSKKLPLITIVLTGSSDEELAVTALKSGADDFVVKKLEFIAKLSEVILFHTTYKAKNKEQSQHKIKVLYVEHHMADVDLTIRHFKKYAPHFQIEHCVDAAKVLDIIKNNQDGLAQYNLLLLDYFLPGLDGLLLTKKLRQELHINIPIVIITGHGNEEVAIQALKMGADDYLVKRDNYIYRLPSLLQNCYQHWMLKQQQKALEKSHEEYKLFFDDDVTGDFIATAEGYLQNCNPAYLKILGFKTMEEARNYDVYKLYKKPNQRQEIIQKVQEHGRLVEYEFDLIRSDGQIMHVIANIIGDFDEQNKLKTIKGYFIDNTERKIAVDELRKLSQAIEQSPASIMITNLEGKIEYVNPKFCAISGYSLKEVKGKTPNILKSGKTTPEEYAHIWNSILSGKEWSGEFLNKRKDGSTYWEHAAISSIKDANGNITHFLAVKEDISKMKEVEFELIAAKEKAEESDQLKTAFLHNISHEIRTPMNAIMGFSDLLNNPDLSFEKRVKYTDIITKSSQQLLSIIDDIVSIATIEAGQEKINEKEINLVALLQHLFDQFNLKAVAKKCELVLDIPNQKQAILLVTDEIKLIQILSNLLSNAIKFTREGKITYGFTILKNEIEFYVKDTGIGIDPAMHQNIFERFRQVEITVTRQYGGSGLGLSISKAYAELLGGKIWLKSELHKGSEFYFTIPFKKLLQNNNDDVEVHQQKTPEINQAKTILIAEDEEANFLFIEELLSNLNLKLIWVSNGLKAVEACRSNESIDLVLMDIKMPVLNGLEAAKQIKVFRPNLPIIAQTAYTTDADAQKALSFGCNDFISKPFKKDALITMIKNQLRG
jgi:PAS domain S-box-containing protein